MRKLGIATLFFAALAWSPATFADDMGEAMSTSSGSNRSTHQLGFYGTLLGDPWPSLIGANAGYHVLDLLRLHAGVSYVSGILILGGGVKAFVPGWNFSPTVGIAGGIFAGTGSFAGANSSLLSFNAGFDYVADTGFNIGFGINTGVTQSTDVLPFLSVGFYFDEL